ncbi:DUF6088 family protein [Mycoplasma sp. 1012]
MISKQIEEIMYKNRGQIFTVSDFLNLASVNTIKSALLRLKNKGKIQHLMRGFFVYPSYIKLLDEYSLPSPIELAEKIAKKYDFILTPTGNTALNMTGISTQVPNICLFLTNWNYKKYKYKNWDIVFKKTSNNLINGFNLYQNLIIQSIKTLGPNISQENIEILKNFKTKNKVHFTDKIKKLPNWIFNIIQKI